MKYACFGKENQLQRCEIRTMFLGIGSARERKLQEQDSGVPGTHPEADRAGKTSRIQSHQGDEPHTHDNTGMIPQSIKEGHYPKGSLDTTAEKVFHKIEFLTDV